VNYYEHHIGDYAEATAHLNFIEDAAYSRLIRKYYAIEKPLPADIKAVQRLVGARTKEEREAVSTVLDEFFTLQDDGWHNQRCDEEVARYMDGHGEREQRATNEKERMRRHREERSNLFAELRELGIIPKWDTPVTQLREMLKRTCNAPATRTGAEQERTCNAPATANQTPDTIHHTKTIKQRVPVESVGEPEKPRAAAVGENSSGSLATVLRKHGVTITPQHSVLLAWVKDGFTLQQMLEAVEVARMRKPDPEPIPPLYLDSILRDDKAKKKTEPPWLATEDSILAKGK
jgi:uncharacterized protein YdaU (DUF1376 family)